ncbi:MAG: hypothetical protein CME68_03140 [Halobacteriovoraceae bacterium]|nr:hypothetical protein [Halobacteriovoraceae bacterium]|tara:strand:+ start:26 stop:289 length:264 start_codon:yes stop_codon:yes gene_type:complete
MIRNDFQTLKEKLRRLSFKLPRETFLKVYGLEKHIEDGPCPTDAEKPSLIQIEERIQFEAWEKNREISEEEAMEQYRNLVKEIMLNK